MDGRRERATASATDAGQLQGRQCETVVLDGLSWALADTAGFQWNFWDERWHGSGTAAWVRTRSRATQVADAGSRLGRAGGCGVLGNAGSVVMEVQRGVQRGVPRAAGEVVACRVRTHRLVRRPLASWMKSPYARRRGDVGARTMAGLNFGASAARAAARRAPLPHPVVGLPRGDVAWREYHAIRPGGSGNENMKIRNMYGYPANPVKQFSC